jgi:hypothetical protein
MKFSPLAGLRAAGPLGKHSLISFEDDRIRSFSRLPMIKVFM